MSYRPPKDLDEQARQARAKLTAHRGMATWGEKLVPLGAFRQAAAATGLALSARGAGGGGALPTRRRSPIPRPSRGPTRGSPSSAASTTTTSRSLALLEDAARRGAEAIYCLGDLGGFGPNPEKVRPLLRAGGRAGDPGELRGVARRRPRGLQLRLHRPARQPLRRHLLRLHRAELLARLQGLDGEPPGAAAGCGSATASCSSSTARRGGSTSSSSTAPRRCRSWRCCSTRTAATASSATHTGLHWHRRLPSGRDVVNVGVIGRPANDGNTHVWYAMLEAREGGLGVELVPLPYDHLGARRRDAGRGAAGGVRRDHPDRLVDDLPGDPARPRAGGFPLLNRRRTSMSKPRIAILGAGPTGLEAALAAAEAGQPFTALRGGAHASPATSAPGGTSGCSPPGR